MVKVMEAAAKSALVTWGREGGLDDLVQDLWVWYLERPATQRKLEELSKPEAIATVRRAAIQILTEQVLAGNKFNGRNLYSSEAVKDVLKDRSNNRYLKDIMPTAMAALEKQHAVYAEALRSRYDDGVIPQDGPSQDALKNAHKAITEHVNIIVITAGDVSSAAVQAETRKSSGGRSDPTADAAIALIEKGDEELELTDQEGNVTGTTTYRTELANVFDDWITHRPATRPKYDSTSSTGCSTETTGWRCTAPRSSPSSSPTRNRCSSTTGLQRIASCTAAASTRPVTCDW